MKNKILVLDKNIFKGIKSAFALFLLVFCSIAGVGLVSGSEVVNFFVKLGNYGYFGLAIFYILVIILMYKITTSTCLSNKINLKQKSKNANVKDDFLDKNIKFYARNNQTEKILNVQKLDNEISQTSLKQLANKKSNESYKIENKQNEKEKQIKSKTDYEGTLLNNKKYKTEIIKQKGNAHGKSQNVKFLKEKYSNFAKKFDSLTVLLNIVCVSGAMCAGLKEFTKSLYNNNYIFIYLLFIIVIFVLLVCGVKWISKINFLVFIFTIFICLSLCFNKSSTSNILVFVNSKEFFVSGQTGLNKIALNILKGVGFGVLYVFMNMFHIRPIVDAANVQFKSKKSCLVFSVLFSTFLTGVLIIFTNFLLKNNSFSEFEMPFLEYFKTQSKFLFITFKLGLVSCLLLSLVSCLLGLKTKLLEYIKLPNFQICFLSFMLALILGILPFNFFIGKVYPFLGFLNLLCFVFC